MSEDDLEAEALASIEKYKDFLATPAYEHGLDVAVLVKIAGDSNVDVRERRRAAEVLAKLRLQAMEGLASLTGARELALEKLGLKVGPTAVSLTNVNQRIEIVRASDWRSAPPLEDGEVVEAEVLPAETNGHVTNGHTPPPPKQTDDDADDPAP